MSAQPLTTDHPPPANDSVREVIETIAVVTVLVLLLKLFVAEAFVIPTGSMATTLLGAHKQVTCPQCGYTFPVNCSSERETPAGDAADPVIGCVCPNCRFHIEFTQESAAPACQSGDRLVVGKFLYDLHLNRVERQQVVVFKYPETPQRNAEALNYIKRLIGKPGETIALYHGDLYVYPGSDQARAEPLTYAAKQRPARPEERWQRDNMYENDPEAVERFKQGKFVMIRKEPEQVLALRRLVYDNDHQAKDLKELKFPPRWAPEATDEQPATVRDPLAYRQQRRRAEAEAAWVAEGASGFRHPSGNGPRAWLRYRHLVHERGPDTRPGEHSPAESKPELITDFMGYNAWHSARRHLSSPAANWVGDLLLECQVTIDPIQGQPVGGQLILELSKGNERFQARWELATGNCSLVRLHDSKEEVLASRSTPLKPGSSHLLRFANVDERLIVWVDRSLPFGAGVAYDEAAESGPFANDLQPASIGVEGAAVRVQKLKLWRDTYYTVAAGSSDVPLTREEWSDPDRWQPLRELPVETLYVQPGHYLCLGDNSPESADSRSWGLVPDRLLLGRALFVYFPLPRFGLIK